MVSLPPLLKTKLILSSSSPRRSELLAHLRLPFTVAAPDFHEQRLPAETAHAYVQRNAAGKAQWVAAHRLPADKPDCYLLLGADTVVVLEDAVLEKPFSHQDAYTMLSKLSGKTHMVLTGLALLEVNAERRVQKCRTEVFTTAVTFAALSKDDISHYIATSEPMDKAGAYGIQGQGSALITSIQGSYTNVMGLPLTAVKDWLQAYQHHTFL